MNRRSFLKKGAIVLGALLVPLNVWGEKKDQLVLNTPLEDDISPTRQRLREFRDEINASTFTDDEQWYLIDEPKTSMSNMATGVLKREHIEEFRREIRKHPKLYTQDWIGIFGSSKA